jgi:hypothetical protein
LKKHQGIRCTALNPEDLRTLGESTSSIRNIPVCRCN